MQKYFLLLMVSSAFLISCGKKKPIIETFQKDTTQVIVKIDSLAFEVDTFRCKKKEKECATEDCSYCDLYYERIKTCLKPVHDSVNRHIDSMVLMGLGWMGGEEKQFDLKERAEAFFASRREMEADNQEVGGAWDWEMSVRIYRACNEIITVNSSWGGYTGGAHPNYESYTACFFTGNGKRVALGDLFTDIEKVNKIGLKYFKKDNQLDTDIDIIDQGWDIADEGFALNENFDIGTESITWQFNSYDIASYANGESSVTIPMKELEKYLKVKFTDVVIQ